jgi:hypothetical protein
MQLIADGRTTNFTNESQKHLAGGGKGEAQSHNKLFSGRLVRGDAHPAQLRPRKKGSDTPTKSLDFRGACRLRSLLDSQKHARIAGQLELTLLGGQDNNAQGFRSPGMRNTNI